VEEPPAEEGEEGDGGRRRDEGGWSTARATVEVLLVSDEPADLNAKGTPSLGR